MESFSMEPVQPNGKLNNDSAHEEKTKSKGLKHIVNRFFHYTTINGLQRLASSRTIIGRLFWLAVVLGALGMFSRDIYELLQQYYDRPVSVVSKIDYFKEMRFPAVTVCNVNAIRKSAYDINDELKNKIEQRDNDECFKEAQRKNNNCEEDKDEVREFDNEINNILSTIDIQQLQKSGHQLDDFIVSCRFNGLRCRKRRYWTQVWDPKYGNCYTFNSRLTGHDPNLTLFRTNKPGSSYGLKLTFNIELNEYIPQLTRDAGVKISVAELREMPFPLFDSISLAPGFNHEIAMKRVHIERVDRYHNGSCRENKELDGKNPYRVVYNAEYSVQACLQYCYALAQINQCGCAEYSYYGATPKGKVCKQNNETNDDCLDKWKESQGGCGKKCRDKCSETIYESSLTFTQWPYRQSVQAVLNELGFNVSDYGDNFRSNFLTANIFFTRFRETKVEESLTYETANLLADIGGQIGLWAGLSVISMCELLELIALLCRAIFYRKTHFIEAN